MAFLQFLPTRNYNIDGAITLTMVRESSGTTTLYALKQDKTIETLGSYTATFTYPETHNDFNTFYINSSTGALVNSIYVYNVAKDADGIKTASLAAYSAAVPEPATTTLSLLALAGLAARRRRK